MKFAVPAIEMRDLRFERLIVAHPSAVAFRICGLKGDVGPVVETYAEIKGLAIEVANLYMCPERVQDVHYRLALQDPIGI